MAGISGLARAVDAKDPATRRHSGRVADLAVQLATVLGWDAVGCIALRDAGLMHDVGKIAVPDAILLKPERLTPGSTRSSRRTRRSARRSSPTSSPPSRSPGSAAITRGDGTGYPDALAGDEIPEGARILAVADAVDVMTSERPYGVPLSREDALAECLRCSGAQFWPEAVDALQKAVAEGQLPEGR